MKKFHRIYPDANSFKNLVKLKKPDDWKIEYIDLGYGIGYWIAEDPFLGEGFDLYREMISGFPIQKDGSSAHNTDPNPFDTIHLPDWAYKDLCFFLRDFYLRNFLPEPVDPQIHEWGNIYFKNHTRPISCWRIPHIDYFKGIVGNLWFTDHDIDESCTKIYKYHGTIINDLYDFQIDKNHPLHNRWRDIAQTPTRADNWFNFSDDELNEWGFEFLGRAPSKVKTMTIYKSDICHLAYITDKIEFRWSHTFAYSHLEKKPFTMKDIFKI
jgi:hypothetical protein